MHLLDIPSVYDFEETTTKVSFVPYTVFYVCENTEIFQWRRKWAAAGKNVVILHQFPRGKFVPNMSPYALKLETYLRMSGIPYEVTGLIINPGTDNLKNFI